MRSAVGLPLLTALLLIAASSLAEDAQELYSQAEQAYQAGDYEKALELFKSLIVHFPDSGLVDRSLFRVGAIFIRKEDFPKARLYFDKLVVEHASSEFAKEALYYRGYCAYKAGDHADAIQDLTQYTSYASGTLRRGLAFLYSARSFAAQGQAGSALAAYSSAWAELPDGPDREAAVIEARQTASGVRGDEVLEGMLDRLNAGPVRDMVALELAKRQVAAGRGDKASATLARADFSESPASIRLEADRLRQATRPKGGGSRDVYIGCVLPLSGRFSIYGEQALKGLMLGIGAYDEPRAEGITIHLLIRDSEGDPDKAALAVRDLAATQVVAIVGPLLSGESVKASIEAQGLGVPLITLTRKDGIADVGDWIFRAFTTDSSQVDALVENASKRRSAKRFAILYPTDQYGRAMAESFQGSAASRGLEVVVSIGYEPTTVDWSRDLRKIDRAGQIDALFIPDFSRAISMIIPQMTVMKQRPLLLGPSGWNDVGLAASLGDQLQGCLIVDGFFEGSSSGPTAEFIRRYKASIGGTPDLISASSYDAGRILDQVLSRNPNADRGTLRLLLLEIKDFTGACGSTSFLQNGEISRPLFLITVGPSGLEEIK